MYIRREQNKLNTRSFDRYTTDGGKKRKRTRKFSLETFQSNVSAMLGETFDFWKCASWEIDIFFLTSAPTEISYYSKLEITRETLVRRLSRLREISTRTYDITLIVAQCMEIHFANEILRISQSLCYSLLLNYFSI